MPINTLILINFIKKLMFIQIYMSIMKFLLFKNNYIDFDKTKVDKVKQSTFNSYLQNYLRLYPIF